MLTEFENTCCPLCGEIRCEIELAAPDRFHLSGGNRYHIVKCSECGFAYLNPRPQPERIAEFYHHPGYQPFLSAQPRHSLWDSVYNLARSVNVRSKRRKIAKLKPPGKILDVGCGTGEFLREMQRHGWQATGLETDERAAAFAGKKYGLKIATRELAAANFDEPFDVITFWHVLEHVFDPVRTLETARKILKGDGVILVACPNLASRDAHFYGSDWVALDAPRHLSHFVPDTMANASTRSGLMVFRSQPMLFDTFYNCLMSEQIIAARTGNKSLPIPFPWVRALTLGGLSWTVSSFDSNKGSAILYYLKKRVN